MDTTRKPTKAEVRALRHALNSQHGDLVGARTRSDMRKRMAAAGWIEHHGITAKITEAGARAIAGR